MSIRGSEPRNNYLSKEESFMYDREKNFPMEDTCNEARIEFTENGGIVNLVSRRCQITKLSKSGAVIAMTRSLARELGADGIAVNAVAPGLTLVEATEDVPKERHELYVKGRAMPRAQRPEDVVGAVLYLLSDGAAFVTGQLLPVNGGFVLH